MRTSLQLLDVQADFICGIHFTDSEFTGIGRLKSTAIPTFFPSRENMIHDHPYHKQDERPQLPEKKEEGKDLVKISFNGNTHIRNLVHN